MRKRDLAILILCAFAIFFSLQHEGDFSFREAWFHLSDDYPIKFEAERLPPPIVADLNGDGKREVLVATHDAKIQVLQPHIACADEGFSEARVLAEVSLLPDKVRVMSGRHAVAMATGVIDRNYKKGQPLKQVLVVVTSGWSVMCFDHNLKKLWETNLQDDFPHNAHLREVAISIYLDPFEEISVEERIAEEHRRSASENEKMENRGTMDLRHFAMYAFAGKTGQIRWKKEEDVQPQSLDASMSIPQHNYKLDVHALNSRHPGEGTTYIPTITNHTRLWWVPNVVVAHEKEGIEAFHLATGRTVCKLHLEEGGLHADINGDGVLDHVQVVGGNGFEQKVISGSMELLRPCWAVATSGVPVREQLFNASICHHSPFNLFHHGDFRTLGRAHGSSSLEVATPILIPINDGHRHRKGCHGNVIFFTNRGEVTAYSPCVHSHEAVWQWQILTGPTWSNLLSPSGMMESGRVVLMLKPFSLRVHDNQQMILAGGDQEAAVISPGGSILTTIELPASPTHALVCEDFSNDGLTDIILVTQNGVYGFVQTRQPGALFFSTLVGCLIVVMGVIFVTQHLNSGSAKPRASCSR